MEIKPAHLGVALLVCAVLAAPAALAGDVPGGTYSVKLREISNSCADAGMTIDASSVAISSRGDALEVKVGELPAMKGKTRKGGKFKVASARGRSPIPGVERSFSAAGLVENGKLQLVLVAEYYRTDKALCTQSWDVSGARR